MRTDIWRLVPARAQCLVHTVAATEIYYLDLDWRRNHLTNHRVIDHQKNLTPWQSFLNRYWETTSDRRIDLKEEEEGEIKMVDRIEVEVMRPCRLEVPQD